MKKIRISFLGFWPGYGNLLEFKKTYLLHKHRYDFIETNVFNSDIVVHSNFYSGKKENVLKVFALKNKLNLLISHESYSPNRKLYNYSLTMAHPNENELNHLYLPNWVSVVRRNDPTIQLKFLLNEQKSLETKKYFCNYIYKKNYNHRKKIFDIVNSIQEVHSFGKDLNNKKIPKKFHNLSRDIQKIEIQKDYKFNLAIENKVQSGYTTEKIITSFFCNNIPIYFGDPNIQKVFNPERILIINNLYDSEIVERINKISSNELLFEEKVKTPVFIDNVLPEFAKEDYIYTFFSKLFSEI